jgi:hypothetical protein
MTDSRWCDGQNWYADDTLSTKINLPQNQTTDVNIKNTQVTLDANTDLSCFYEIPHLQCNKLNIVATSGGRFRCAKLDGSEIGISGSAAPKIQIEHWLQGIFCDWSVLTLSTVNCEYNYVSIKTSQASSGSMSGIGLSGSNINMTNCYIDTPVAVFQNCTLSKNTKIFCKESGYLDNCTIDDTSILNGIFYIKDGISNASGMGQFTFYGSSINNGNLNGANITFEDSSRNNGNLNGSNILFSGACLNNGNISGNPVFCSGATNNKNIYGNSTFIESTNNGSINNNCLFSGSINNGSISGKSVFLGSSINSGLLNIGTFNSSVNYGSITGNAYFANSYNYGNIHGQNSKVNFSGSNNYGAIYNVSSISFYMSNNFGDIYKANNDEATIGEITFVSGSNNSSNISDNYRVTFFDSGINNGSILRVPSVIFNDMSMNQGTIDDGPIASSIITFNKQASNSGSIQNKYIAIFNNYTSNSSGSNIISGIFNNFSYNAGNCEVGIFKNQSYNLEQVVFAQFFNNSYNSGICENNELYNNSINYGDSNITTLYDSSVNSEQGQIISGTFTGTSKNFGTITTTAAFVGTSLNSGTINSNCNVFFYEKSKNLKDILSTKLIYFYDNSINQANLINCQYSGYSQNQGATTSGFFHGHSVNKNFVDYASFYNSGINKGSIGTSVSFYDRSVNNDNLNGISVNFYEYSANKSSINGCSIQINDHFINSGSINNTTLLNFRDHSENRGILLDNNIKFTNSSKNYGTIINDLIINNIIFSGDIFHDTEQDYCANNGNIASTSGLVLFSNSINYGYANAINTIFSNSINYGKTNYAEFYNQSINSGFIISGIFFTNSINYRQIQYGTFVASYNYGDITSTSGNASFSEQSSNYGTISCNAIFDESSCTGIPSQIFGTLIGNPSECIQQSGLD